MSRVRCLQEGTWYHMHAKRRRHTRKEPTMLIVDSQIHIWKNNLPTNPAHRQVKDWEEGGGRLPQRFGGGHDPRKVVEHFIERCAPTASVRPIMVQFNELHLHGAP